MQLIWECFINFFEIVLFYIFIHQKLHTKKDLTGIRVKQYLFLFFRFVVVCFMNQTDIPSTYTLTLSCLLEICFACVFYSDKFLYKTFIGLLYTVLCMIAEFIPFFSLTLLTNIPSAELLSFGTLRTPVTVLYLTLVAALVFLFRYLFNKEPSATLLQKVCYTVISFSGIAIGHYVLLTMIYSEQFGIHEISHRLAIINLIFMLLFLALLVFIYQLGITYSNTQKLIELKKARTLEEKEYRNMMTKVTALRNMKHDLDNHLNALEMMAKQLASPEMYRYIDGLRNSLESSHIFVSTGNLAVDCILSSKISLAKDYNIHTDFSVLLNSNFRMDAVTICSLLGNLWDNAIEACQNIFLSDTNESPYITFYMKPYQDMTIIHIENNFCGELSYHPDGELQTTKQEPEHGIGLKRITNIVNKEQGIIKIDINKPVFSVHILIPDKGELE